MTTLLNGMEEDRELDRLITRQTDRQTDLSSNQQHNLKTYTQLSKQSSLSNLYYFAPFFMSNLPDTSLNKPTARGGMTLYVHD